MAGRFSSLEFDGQGRDEEKLPHRQGGAGEAVTAQAYVAKARAADQWGEYETALRLYTRALQEDRAAIPAWVGQVQMLVLLGECREARMWSDKALELFRNNGELLAAKAQACLRQRERNDAMACSDASLAAPGSSAWRWQVRGEVLLDQQRRHAEECFQKSLAEADADWFDRIVIARIYLRYNRATNALSYAQAAAGMRPTHGYVWFVLGNCQKSLGLKPLAQESYQRCLQLREGYGPALRAIERLDDRPTLFGWAGGLLRRWRGR